ncbi:SusC/RagA family TonB-linked outer membrane protein [Chitinophaga sp. RCC_12]|uniref:SusC/RagA family TonB-linked outer membrane protein n=1 Tax=Chitinophaga sp. RCC_12 TaxID=3239226 RepID=UPI003525ED30
MTKMHLGVLTSKLPLIIAILTGICYSTSTMGEGERQISKVTLSANNIPLEKAFKKIQKQTGIKIYNNVHETFLNEQKKVTVNFKQADIREVMTFLLIDKENLFFTLNNNEIHILRERSNLSINKFDTIPNIFQLIGKILDKDGNPIPGVSIKLKSNNQGTISNSDGTFRLPKVDKGSVIVITSIGFESKEIVIIKNNILVQLNTYTNLLDEKVVIAYGSTTKRLNTGNISSLKATDIERQPVGNPLNALQGRVPGIYIQQSNGLPGSGVTVRIQGVNSISSGNDPFYVVDGVPYVSQLLPIYNTITGGSGVNGVSGNPLSYLNSADIESIEILKDADATAIYGSRAANGAVLITTKKGKSGPTRINIMFQSGWAKVSKRIDLLDTEDYLAMRREAIKNDGNTISPFDYDLNGTWDTMRNVNWQKELIGKSAQYTDAQLNISGGNALTQFLLGGGYHRETTVYPGSFSDTKASLHLNLSGNSLNQKFKIQFTGSFIFDDNKLPLNDLTTSAITLAPNAPKPYNSDGTINWMPTATGASSFSANPFASTALNSTNKTSNLIGNAVLSYELLPGLIIKSSFGFNNLLTDEITKSPNSIYQPEYQPDISNASVFIKNKISSWIVEPQIEYKTKISKGILNILIGSSLTQQNSDQQNVLALGFSNELVMEDLSSATSLTGSSINAVYKYNAIYSRVTYNWLDKYILNLTSRRDGSSRFGPENQFHNFGAVGAAWIFSQEPFIQSKIPFLSFGKLRGSFGSTGNDQIGDYRFMDIYQPLYVTGNAYQNIIGLSPSRITNPYLQWEKTRKLQIGMELGLSKDRILLTVNYNQNRSNNQLTQARLPSITGFTGITRNFPAVIQNTGWELSLTTTNIKKDHFYWTSNFNITIPKNQLRSYYGRDKNNSIYIGKPLSTIAYYNYAGLNDTTGVYQFIDTKGNITISPSDPIDKTVALNTDPKLYGGLQNSFNYKGFTMDIFLMFAKRTTIDDVTYGLRNIAYPGTFNGGAGNQSTTVLNRWQKTGDKAQIQPYSAEHYENLDYIKYSSAILTDASFISLRNISISWQFPDHLNRILHIINAKVFLNAQNILTVTNYKGFNPESGLSLPPLRTVTIGAQITL